MIEYTPMYDNIIIIPRKAKETTIGGLYIPDADTALEYSRGEVLAVGQGRIAGESVVPLTVKVGDIVLYRKMTEISLNNPGGDELFLISEGSVFAIEHE